MDGQHTKTPELWERFTSMYTPVPFSGCWIWLGTGSRGYGSIAIKRKHQGAHRISYLLHKGPIPEGFDVDHLCGVKACVNPEHLEAVSHEVNCQRRNAKQLTCKNGHPWSGKNNRGDNVCHTCMRDAARKYRRVQKMNGDAA
jgi:hypothetical protein